MINSSNGSNILSWNNRAPMIAKDAFIAPNATVIGDVKIGSESSIWFNAVVRADVNYIRIGRKTNVQDGTVIHVSSEGYPTVIGNEVLIGHMAVIHACTIEDQCFIGMSATIMDGAVIKKGAFVAAGALVTPGQTVLSGELWSGVPAKLMRSVRKEESDKFPEQIERYAMLAQKYSDLLQDKR
jgi:carbonic anhydrase/acetyltransferase-like protein (isoleucine patch superfamily)